MRTKTWFLCCFRLPKRKRFVSVWQSTAETARSQQRKGQQLIWAWKCPNQIAWHFAAALEVRISKALSDFARTALQNECLHIAYLARIYSLLKVGQRKLKVFAGRFTVLRGTSVRIISPGTVLKLVKGLEVKVSFWWGMLLLRHALRDTQQKKVDCYGLPSCTFILTIIFL